MAEGRSRAGYRRRAVWALPVLVVLHVERAGAGFGEVEGVELPIVLASIS